MTEEHEDLSPLGYTEEELKRMKEGNAHSNLAMADAFFGIFGYKRKERDGDNV